MIKRLYRCLFGIALVCLLSACDEKSEVFYTTTYDVVRMEVSVTLQAATPLKPSTSQPEEQPDTTSPEEEGDETNPTPDEEVNDAPDDDTPGPSVAELIREQALAEAIVQVGGSYIMDFKHFDSGFLTAQPSAGEAPITGAFSRTPGSSTLRLHLPEHSYTYTIASYRYGTTSLTQFRIDLTKEFQKLYPNHMIQRVERIEYTSHPY